MKPFPREWLRLSMLAGGLMVLASCGGVFFGALGRETLSWAVQGMAQDFVNLVVVAPVLLVSTWCAWRGPQRLVLVWLGVILYLTYSYIMYAFGVHFGPWFLVYVVTLGSALFALIGGTVSLDWEDLERRFATVNVRPLGYFLMTVAAAFALLWLADILRAVSLGTVPQGLADIGLPSNPVHVLDLAFLLPLTGWVGIAAVRGERLGRVLVVPLLTFQSLMGCAVMAMAVAMSWNGLGSATAVVVLMGTCVAVSLTFIIKTLRTA